MMMEKRCPYCHGQGTVPDPKGILSTRAACPICQGRGFNLIPKSAELCGFCRSNGKVDAEDGGTKICPDCKGLGFTW
jgi:DnaJ-class molecular chaperone